MAIVLKLTDGTTTLNLNDLTNYALPTDDNGSPQWAPRVAMLQRRALGTPYEDVVEDITIHVRGSTGANALANVTALGRLLEQAARFARGENVSPVKILYRPHNTASGSDYEALVLGQAGNDPMLVLPPDLNHFDNKEIPGVVLHILRRGLWLCSTQSANAAADNGSLGGPIDLTAAVDNLSPTKLSLTNVFSRSDLPSGFLALTDTAGSIVVVNAESLVAPMYYTSVNDSGNFALNTNVLRYSPANTAPQRSLPANVLASFTGKQIAIYVNARVSSGTTTYAIKVRFGTGSAQMFDETPLKALPATGSPQWFCVGVIALQYVPTWMDISLQASAASGALDIDSVVIVDVSAPNTKVIGLDWKAYDASSTVTVTVDHRLLTGISPLISDASVALVAWGWRGDVIFETKLRYVYWLLMRTGGASTATRWRTESGAAVHSNTVTATRSIAYLVPQ